MSINHYSLELPETTPYWATQHQNQPAWFNSQTTSRLNENDDDDDIEETTIEKKKEGTEDVEEKEAMFEKPLTPSDVGKLNRLVIPKQHAEKYFPLGSDSGECKGLLLSFEDESGKCWRFRYSYWNSSQSYVLTKGWSRYVKEKRLDAGDVVLFQRFRYDSKRLFIGWRRRDSAAPPPNAHVSRHGSDGNGNSKNEVGGGVGWTRGFYSAHHPYPAHHHPLPYQHDCPHAGSRGTESQKQRTKAVGNSSSSTSCSSSRVLRLFGVNMECQPEQHDHNSGVSITTTTTTTEEYSYNNLPSTQPTNDTHHFYPLHHHQPNSHSPNPHHMLRHQPYYY